MLYKHNTTAHLEEELFQNPTSEYRGAPFWAWNCKLDPDQLVRQIDCLKEMGLGGFHMHPRTGLGTTYLSDEFMDCIKVCVEKAKKEKMLAWLYDEDRWPSGFAGGLVTKNPAYRSRNLLFTPVPYQNEVWKGSSISSAASLRTENGKLLACYDITLNPDGSLKRASRIEKWRYPTGVKWYAYVETPNANPWYNNQTYVNTLDKKAMDEFIKITYESYQKKVGDDFGDTIPSIFTDEPQFPHKTTLGFAQDQTDVMLPWADDLPQTFEDAYSRDLLEVIPELIWDLPDGKVSQARYQYHDHIAERFAQAFADNCGSWCEQHGIMLTGHMMEEPTLQSQTAALGDAMRSYRSFQLPGIDMLCDSCEYTTAKQAQSASHQFGREGVLSELYGVTGWDFDFRGHKFQGDWQAALGVTARVQHLSWVSMAGEAKRDYPATMNYQSPWYKEYRYVEDHFARVNTALTRGKPIVKVGVIHPVESYWLYWGPKENTAQIREQMDSHFQELTKWLLFGAQDFDFISESLLPQQCTEAGAPLQVGHMAYDVIIVPDCLTLRSSTVERLKAFHKAGGKLVFAGDCPRYVDAVENDAAKQLYQESIAVPFEKNAILNELESNRQISLRNEDGTAVQNSLYQYRQDQDSRWLFIAHATKPQYTDVTTAQKVEIRIMGKFTPVLYDTISGSIEEIDYRVEDGKTILVKSMYPMDSLLLQLRPYQESKMQPHPESFYRITHISDCKHKVSYRREEPNVCLLDMAEYALDRDEFMPVEEILRADNKLRLMCGYPSRVDAVAQPWVIAEEEEEHTVRLRFTVHAELALTDTKLALEDAQTALITCNGEAVDNTPVGYYVDESIKTVALPALKKGENVIVVTLPFAERRNLESCYLLGEFNVRVEGCEVTLVPMTDTIGFGSITEQGLPFYGGNLSYTYEVEITAGRSLEICTSHYRGAAICVDVDGVRIGLIAYAPYTIRTRALQAGTHTVTLTLLGNRYNTFAALHNADLSWAWHGPNAWRTQGDAWSYEYRLKPTGILKSPLIAALTRS